MVFRNYVNKNFKNLFLLDSRAKNELSADIFKFALYLFTRSASLYICKIYLPEKNFISNYQLIKGEDKSFKLFTGDRQADGRFCR